MSYSIASGFIQIGYVYPQVIRKRKKMLLSGRKQCANEQEGKCAKAFLDLLIKHHLQDNSFTEEDISEEVNTFLFAVSY